MKIQKLNWAASEAQPHRVIHKNSDGAWCSFDFYITEGFDLEIEIPGCVEITNVGDCIRIKHLGNFSANNPMVKEEKKNA